MSDNTDNDGSAEFQKKVLTGVETLKTNQQKLLEDTSRLDATTKKALEDLTAATKRVDDVETVVKSLQKLQGCLKRESQAAFGQPGARISRDPELKALFNAAVRLSMNPEGDYTGLGKEILKVAGLEKALDEATTPGSTLINADLASEIYDTLAQYGAWSSLGLKRVGTKTTKFPVKTARPVAGFFEQNGTGELTDDTAKAGTSVSVDVSPLGALINVQRALLEDAEFDVTADVMEDFAQAYSAALDTVAFTGTGASNYTNGGYTGLFNGATAVSAATGHTTVATTNIDDWLKVLLAVTPAVLSRKPRWWMHTQQLVRALGVKDGNGRPIFLTALEAPAYGSIGSILGYPVTPVAAAPNAEAAGASIAAFGDPQAYVVGQRTDYTFEASDHYKWTTLQRSFRAFGRVGVGVRQAAALANFKLAAI